MDGRTGGHVDNSFRDFDVAGVASFQSVAYHTRTSNVVFLDYALLAIRLFEQGLFGRLGVEFTRYPCYGYYCAITSIV